MEKSIQTEILINHQPPNGDALMGTIPAQSFLNITSRLVEGVTAESDPAEVALRWAGQMEFMGEELPVSILAVARMAVDALTADVINGMELAADQDGIYDHYSGKFSDGEQILSINVVEGEMPDVEDTDILFGANRYVLHLMQTALFAALNFAELDSVEIDVGYLRLDFTRKLELTLYKIGNRYYQVSMDLGYAEA